MQATIIPGRCTRTTVAIPPSKSMAHRAIICAALAQGESLIHHVDYSDDILTTIEGMRKLGAHIELEGSDVRVQGIPDFNQLQSEEIFCKESGSTLRFFIPIFSLTGKRVRFTGQNRLPRNGLKLKARCSRATSRCAATSAHSSFPVCCSRWSAARRILRCILNRRLSRIRMWS